MVGGKAAAAVVVVFDLHRKISIGIDNFLEYQEGIGGLG